MDQIKRIENDIKILKIQGATGVALAVCRGIEISSKYQKQPKDTYSFLKKVAKKLAFRRPTEPMAQNAIKFIFEKQDQSVRYYLQKTRIYEHLIKNTKQKILKFASNLIKDKGLYFTLCHSSCVVSSFIKAKKQGKVFSVINTETRPLYQGRTTAKELLRSGIKDITFIVDSLSTSVIEENKDKLSAVLVGADLLGKSGFINKIGTLSILRACERNNIPFYSLSCLLKFNSSFNKKDIEIRDKSEVWKNAPKDLNIYNPAFDYVPYTSDIKIVTEAGIISGKQVVEKTQELYTFLSS